MIAYVQHLYSEVRQYPPASLVRLLVAASLFVWCPANHCCFGESRSSSPLKSYSEATNRSVFSFADLQGQPGSSVETSVSYSARIGILPVENPFWTVEDSFFRDKMDCSGFAVDFCERLKERFVSSRLFPATIELPAAAAELARKGLFQEIGQKWNVDLVLTGTVTNQDGVVRLTIYTTEGRELVTKVFGDCWKVAALCGQVLTTFSQDPRLDRYRITSGEGTLPSNPINQPQVTTAKVRIQCSFSEHKEGEIYINTYGNATLLPLAVAGLIYSTTSAGRHAQGELTLWLDGKEAGGHLKPSSIGPIKRRYDWMREIAVRPGRHRLVIGGIEKGASTTHGGNVYYTDFTIADNEEKTIAISPQKDKNSWAITISTGSENQ
jgi:hypothetical protein